MNMNVVVVDDTRTNVAVLSHLITSLEGCVAIGFTVPQEGLAWCAENVPDIVIVDYIMPVLDGIEFIRRLRATPGREDVPVLMVTANDQLAVRHQALEAGANDFLTRPIDIPEFMARLRNMLSLRRAQRKLADHALWLETEVQIANAQLNQKVIELQESDERYRKLFEEATDAIAYADAETGEFLDLNQSFADLLGWERTELIGKFQRIIHHDVGEAAVSSSFELARSGLPGNTIETQALTKDGRILDVSIKATVIELNGRKGVIGSFRDITAQKQAELKLAASYSKLRQLALHLDNVREDERARIAREIHDEMGATLTALKMSVHWLASKLPPDMAQFTAETEHMDKLVADMTHTMRHVVSQLMPTQMHDLGFASAVENYVRNFRKLTGIECVLVLPKGELMLDENQSSTLFRILQESLNNIAKHAQATSVNISFIKRNDSLTLVIKDNGVGFDRAMHRENSFGLLGISERAMMVNGKARISSQPGKGTQVAVRIPLAGK